MIMSTWLFVFVVDNTQEANFLAPQQRPKRSYNTNVYNPICAS